MNKTTRGIGVYIFLALMFIMIIFGLRDTFDDRSACTYREFQTLLDDGKVVRVEITQNQTAPTGVLDVTEKDGTVAKVNVSDVNTVQELLNQYSDVTVELKDVEKDGIFLTTILPILLTGAMLLFFIAMMGRQSGGGNSRMMNFGKSRARMISPDSKRVMFRDVAGLKEEKEDLQELVEFLKEPEKFLKVGARIPKGVLLVGPPGTGKTLLAKAVAGEAGVPFFSISGSDFVEMFVGVGASRVRDLFEDAKRHQPCIIFIDEIDAVARRRGTGMGGGHDEREQTLNQLLVEMDGFGVNQGIIVMAATNRVDILDPAILRPGRFDRQVAVGRPDIKGREEILQVHSKGKPLGDDVDLSEIAQNNGRIYRCRSGESDERGSRLWRPKSSVHTLFRPISTEHLSKVGIGAEKKSRIISEKEKRITAYHESGHAILFHLLPDVGPVHTISIIPTGTRRGRIHDAAAGEG